MTFSESVKTCLIRKYFFVIKGRASRSEFWFFMLFIALINIATGALFSLLPDKIGMSLSLAVSLALLPANVGAAARRLHDRGLSAWWLWLPIAMLALRLATGPGNQLGDLLALSMTLLYLVILCLPSLPGANKYGPEPGSEVG
ncbi:MAG: DUF805 domain-containing protein [Desulfovibrio sp.]|nr:DUF805 domain-containing protein [Desulfovibrio sp.]